MSFKNRTIVVTGASRGIGRAIALAFAKQHANVCILAKTQTIHPKLPGTIYSVAREVEELGGKSLPIPCDLRNYDQTKAAMDQCAAQFGSIDVLICNASAISLTPLSQTDPKRHDLMMGVNERGTYAACHAALSHMPLDKHFTRHIVVMCPPLEAILEPSQYAQCTPYAVSKFGMSMIVAGLEQELQGKGIHVTGLWPKTVISTSALRMIPTFAQNHQDNEMHLSKKGRKPEIMADAVVCLVREKQGDKSDKQGDRQFWLDEDVLRELGGVREFEKYQVDPDLDEADLVQDLFLPSSSKPQGRRLFGQGRKHRSHL